MTLRRSTRLAATGALLVLLVGCTPVDDAEPSPTPSASASADAEPGITDITDTPGSGEGYVGALADSTVGTCALADGAWTVAGTVTNPTEAAADYRIYVSLLAASGETRALQQVDVDALAATESTDWTATVPVADEGLSCVLRVERYAA
ncbi:MAG: hypothetical protein RI885_2781 [Actinomycetota bacterium]